MTRIAELRGDARDGTPHPESLLNVPLIRQAFCDEAFRLIPRSTDVHWTYNRWTPVSVSGFNPFQFAYYYGQESQFAAWLTRPLGSARDINENDLLVKEVLMMVHDYLHAWAYAAIDRQCPELCVLHGDITPERFEHLVFCHLLSEAVATVGLDYWFLCRCDINEFCPIGSTTGALTVGYRETLLPEYRRFCPSLQVQSPQFFRTIATFYCTGEFPGFDVDDMRRSPMLLAWLRHELSYGARQRAITRDWLSYLARSPIAAAEVDPQRPLDIDTELHSRLIDETGVLLWEKVNAPASAADDLIAMASARPATRSAPETKPPDFRFVNLACVPAASWASGATTLPDTSFKFFLSQLLGQTPLSSFPQRLLRHIPLLLAQRDVSLAVDLLHGMPRRDPLPHEPRDLLMVG